MNVKDAMLRAIFRFAFALAVICAAWPVQAQSVAETAEAIGKARVSTRILFVTAHPDDEASALLSYLSHGLGADVALMTLTRGQGGQNAIGPEQGEELGILRTSELLAASQHNGVTQYFSRAPDFGFSKSAEQTMKIWGDVPLEDMVRVIRTFRPDIVINGWGGVHSGHGQHQASGILTPKAVALAAEPSVFPDQFKQGLVTWKVSWVLDVKRSEQKDGFRVPLEQISAIWGKSYNEFGRESLVFHRSQGVTAFLGAPYLRMPLYLVVEEGSGETKRIGPRDLAEDLAFLAGDNAALRKSLTEVDHSLSTAQEAALRLDWDSMAKSLADGGSQISELEKSAPKQAASNLNLRWELAQVRQRIDRALADACAVHIEARADMNEIVAGHSFHVNTNVTLRRSSSVTFHEINLVAPAGWNVVSKSSNDANEAPVMGSIVVSVPEDGAARTNPGDVILPFAPPLVMARADLAVGDYSFAAFEPVVSVQTTSTSVDTYPLTVVPAVTLTMEPRQIVQPEARAGEPIELLARVRHHGEGAVKVEVGVDAPGGWSVSAVPALSFEAAGDQLVQFAITPPRKIATGNYSLQAFAKAGGKRYSVSVEPLPSLPTRMTSETPKATVHIFDLKIPAALQIGYIAAANDTIPESLGQLGIGVRLLSEVDLAFGDLSRFDAIVVGIRAYELREDLLRANSRLIDYVENGGTLVVQYEKNFTWNRVLPAPFPARMSDVTLRTTNPESPVAFLAPGNPLLNYPNKITPDDFKGWVQERGLYYWATFDNRYQPVLGLTDPGEDQDNGALVYAKVGNGVYIYTGLSFFRELPAGVPGAYRLFVNLISQRKNSALNAAHN